MISSTHHRTPYITYPARVQKKECRNVDVGTLQPVVMTHVWSQCPVVASMMVCNAYMMTDHLRVVTCDPYTSLRPTMNLSPNPLVVHLSARSLYFVQHCTCTLPCNAPPGTSSIASPPCCGQLHALILCVVPLCRLTIWQSGNLAIREEIFDNCIHPVTGGHCFALSFG